MFRFCLRLVLYAHASGILKDRCNSYSLIEIWLLLNLKNRSKSKLFS